jgi:Na+-transporting NADH:ubiquinone oxidoreductase subunit NqrF
MSDPDKSAVRWTGETGFICDALLARHVADLALPTWYVVGPPAMTAAVRDVLTNLGVDDSAVRVEDFAGY